MPDRSGNKIRNVLGRSLILAGLLALIALPAGAERNSKVLIGVRTGWSFGLGDAFDWHNGDHYTDDYNMTFFLGTYVQYDLSRSFGLQFNVNYQSSVYRWKFSYPGMPSDSGTDGTGFLSVGLDGVCSLNRVKNSQLYFLGGGGAFSANSVELNGYYIDFVGGMGIKIFLKRGSRSAVNIGGMFHHLLQPKSDRYIDDKKADFLRFQVGYEFCPK